MQLLKIQNRLVIIKGQNRYSFPFGYRYDRGIVKIWSLDDTDFVLEGVIGEILDSNSDPFFDIDELEWFLLPLLGFNTASGGSEVVGTTENGTAGHFTATGAGTAVKAIRTSGIASHSVGKKLIEQYDTGVNTDDAIFEVNATNLGSLLAPRVTTSQKNSIPAVTPGLMVYDTDLGRYEVWNGSYYAGSRNRINIFHGGGFNPANNVTYRFSCYPIAPISVTINPAPYAQKFVGNGVIRSIYLNAYCSTAPGTAEAWSLFIRVNNIDYLVQTVASTSGVRIWENNAMNIPYINGQTWEMIWVSPTSGTRAQGLISAGHIITE